MATIRAAPLSSISAIGCYRWALRPGRRGQPARAEQRSRAPEPQRLAAVTTYGPAAQLARLSLARRKAAPATASPAQKVRDRPLEKVTCSCCQSLIPWMAVEMVDG